MMNFKDIMERIKTEQKESENNRIQELVKELASEVSDEFNTASKELPDVLRTLFSELKKTNCLIILKDLHKTYGLIYDQSDQSEARLNVFVSPSGCWSFQINRENLEVYFDNTRSWESIIWKITNRVCDIAAHTGTLSDFRSQIMWDFKIPTSATVSLVWDYRALVFDPIDVGEWGARSISATVMRENDEWQLLIRGSDGDQKGTEAKKIPERSWQDDVIKRIIAEIYLDIESDWNLKIRGLAWVKSRPRK